MNNNPTKKKKSTADEKQEKKRSSGFIRMMRSKGMKVFLWFLFGSVLGLFFFCSFLFIYYKQTYADKVIPGVQIDGVSFEGKTYTEVQQYFGQKNNRIANTRITFSYGEMKATASAEELGLGYNDTLLADQVVSVGKSDNIISNINILIQAYVSGINFPASYKMNDSAFETILKPFQNEINVPPVNALFTIENGKVSAFQPSSDGKAVNEALIRTMLFTEAKQQMHKNSPNSTFTLAIPVTITHPDTSTDEANSMGVSELIGSGTSVFAGSITNRIYNINLASSKLNGVLIAPGEVFSFVKTVGDISKLTGYKEAYVIQNGRTVLGDGGGVCQVSTTLFRALLTAGLPIVERNAHAYRVHYYEEDSPPGIDAAVYSPTVDLKFKNDTGHHILIQTIFDGDNNRLTFNLYGTKDGREVSMTKPVILSQTPPPDPLYQDDPTLPKDQVEQVDWAAWGANVYFTRQVKKDNKIVISDKFVSNYRPWQAVYLRGTKEN